MRGRLITGVPERCLRPDAERVAEVAGIGFVFDAGPGGIRLRYGRRVQAVVRNIDMS
jgi:hypothetical protein